MSKAIEFSQCCPLCGKEFSEEKIRIKLADIISRKTACQYISKLAKEYREMKEYPIADGMILASRYAVKRVPTLNIRINQKVE